MHTYIYIYIYIYISISISVYLSIYIEMYTTVLYNTLRTGPSIHVHAALAQEEVVPNEEEGA